MNNQNYPLLSFLLLLFLSLCFASPPPPNDTNALTLFRLQTDTHGNLLANWTGTDACSSTWRGVACSSSGRVSALSLPFLSLRGPITSLSPLHQLRILDLHSNRLNGTVLALTNCTNLQLVYLSNNDFSGQIPPEISSLKRLLRLDLSDNNINGNIPNQLSTLTRLLTLRLQNNEISGEIPDLSTSLANLKQLNLSNNQLHGKLPDKLFEKFGQPSFTGNQGLCGPSPLPVCSSGETPASAQTVDSNPTQMPITTQGGYKAKTRKGLSPGAIVAIVVANCVVLLVLISFMVAHFCAKERGSWGSKAEAESRKRRRRSYGDEKKVYANGGGGYESEGSNGSDKSKLVFFERMNKFELEDLLRASAEMLGKGSLGTVYKAVLDDASTVVAVKRLKDANPCGRKEFEQYMDIIGKLKHPNVVRLRAYYYAKEEKLLVYDYLPNGSLHSLLHENRGPGRIPLDWTTRISLVLGAARGLARIHEEYSEANLPHGNVKSSNVLLDKNGVALVSDFGLSLLLNPVHAIARLGGYRAPEQAEIKRLSQKADVYSFGVLLLEVLTGRAPTQYPSPTRPQVENEKEAVDLPKWVRSVVKEEWTAEVFDKELLRYKNIEEELVSMLHVGLACVVPQPEKRPTMAQVRKLIEDIRVEQSPLGEDYDDSRSSLSPSLATTEDGLPAGY
ncbi:Pkinase domain-containing protein/LRR_1 domain-containing protein/LRRNT_2 domain-containing protein [Cephalotus follicularis]|uniref:Pkinase domain-containing protein/LRR_1 domain-containing protein/LRRNT_2 domain-containing protein n=1 Tax=Cephalotus follicularis TaxID=3775 RepID=A0A1Q3B7E8_CEPFO|nr:Pkinase domain-containing protein/LRR_1 domain-containing protein/LRRNT_2 domain-containing protein [Cephalotus follicularis]